MILCSTFAHPFPSVCSVVNTKDFKSCLELRKSVSTCQFPSRPCVHFTYYVPQYFIEVISHPKTSFFSSLPRSLQQLKLARGGIPFGAEADGGTYSFHAHTLNVPFTMWAFSGMPCGGALWDNMCFTSMSEHLGMQWKTGYADLWQPAFLAWSSAPKACLIKGAISSAMGGSRPTGYPAHSAMCSMDRSWLTKYPPSNQAVCNGWGIVFPRYGTVVSSDQNTASLIIASRIRSLGSEVFQSVPTFSDEKWQMIYPQSSSCFREGQNIGFLRVKRVSEMGRLWNGKLKNYLYVIWRKVRCTKDIPFITSTYAWLSILQGACKGLK